jgi:hypothetical protein
METGATPTITLGGKEVAVVMPESFAEREDIRTAWGEADTMALTRRAHGLTLGLCVPGIAKAAKADYDAMGCDGLAYGKRVYDHLRAQKVSALEISTAATSCYHLCGVSLYPREPEVKAKADFTGPVEAAPT